MFAGVGGADQPVCALCPSPLSGADSCSDDPLRLLEAGNREAQEADRWALTVISLECFLNASLSKFSKHVEVGGDPGADLENARGIAYPI